MDEHGEHFPSSNHWSRDKQNVKPSQKSIFLFFCLFLLFLMREKKNDNKFNELLPRFFYLLKVSPMESLLRSSTHFLDKKIAGKKKHFFKNPGRISFYNKSKWKIEGRGWYIYALNHHLWMWTNWPRKKKMMESPRRWMIVISWIFFL